jgi:hypothetical protein
VLRRLGRYGSDPYFSHAAIERGGDEAPSSLLRLHNVVELSKLLYRSSRFH